MIFAALVLLTVSKLALGAPSVSGAPRQSPPIFRNECNDPKLNDCPPETSKCYDLAYEYMCQCKPGFVDQSPNKKTKPGIVCVSASDVVVAATSGTEGPALPTRPTQPTQPTQPIQPDISDFSETTLGSVSSGGTPTGASASTVTTPSEDSAKGQPNESLSRLSTSEDLARDDGKGGDDSVGGVGGDEATFKSFDTNKDGKINLAELRTATKNNKLSMSDNDVKNMLKGADKNGDGAVNLEEFQELMKGRKSL